MKILWNLLCQYNNIYKRKKLNKKDPKKKKNCNYYSYSATWYCSYCSNLIKKKKRQSGSPKLHCRWIVENVVWTVAKHCCDIAAFYIVNRYIRKKSTNWWLKKKKKHIEQFKSTVAFTHSSNKCQNIFTKHLFLVMVGHNFIFYYFIILFLTYKKLTPQ